MEIQHFGHKKHKLGFIDVGEEVEAPLCRCCKYLIRGHAYTCRHCDFWLHKVCAELPSEIDSFHPHKLSLYPRLPHSYFICNACEDLNLAFVYHCVSCNFSLDVKCAALKDGQYSSERFKAKDKVKKISGHRHPLARCIIRKELEIICVACQQLISDDLAYSYIFLSNYQIFLHESCVDIPEAVHTHPFHQQHSLHRVLLVNGTYRTCKACWMPIQGVGFECKLCQFILHVSCAYYRGRPLKHACHEHDLFHFKATKGIKSARPMCLSCKRSCTSSFYRCYKCDVNFHLECMPLLPKIKCEVHEHPLVISASFAEEKSVNCYSCGEKRDAEQEVYACKECPYVAHIECVASGVEHFSHDHALCFCEVIDREKTPCCSACSHLIINGPASACLCCNFWLHKSCMDLPSEIRHPYHSEHSLTLCLRPPNYDSMDFTCDGCGDLIRGFTFHCKWCSFDLDVKCALQQGVQPDVQRKGIKATLKHFCHDQHSLIRCNIRKELGIDCMSCLETISGLAYACCMCKFYIDLSCLNIPQHAKSLYHKHTLFPRAMRPESQATCNACLTPVEGFAFWCEECKFNLHVSCINAPTRALKHDCHMHGLYYFAATKRARSVKCMVCDTSCNDSFFRCVECDFNIHLRCVPLPSTTKHKSHLHPLHFLEHVEEYHCDICETKRGREHEVYACKDCSYMAHIECALSSSEAVPVQHFSHDHALFSTEVIDWDNAPCCNGCSHLINDPAAFFCSSCKFWLHKSCMQLQLPSEIQHPYHSRHHLTLHPKPPYYDSKDFICDGCGDLIRGFTFHCKWCRFYLDVKCASQQGVQLALQRRGINTTLNSFCHEHTLIGCYLRMELGIYCMSCLETISGFAYACCVCQFYIHESCLNIPQEAKSLYHEHNLTPRAIGPKDLATCNACLISVTGFGFWCENCNFNLHVPCINDPTRALKHMCHKHDLYYFAATRLPRSAKCKVCDMSCDHSFFRCVECDINFHLHCVPLPLTVKHKLHWHSLCLMDSYIEVDYLNEYYCDICETPRNVEHGIYACKDCLYVAHIECVASQEKVHCGWHLHALFFGKVREDKNNPFCSGCGFVINDPAYTCLECNFWLDKSCFNLRKVIDQHPLHLKHQHSLRLKWSSDQFFLCACGYLSKGLYYECSACDFFVDVICSSSSNRQYFHGSRTGPMLGINFLSESSFEKFNLDSCSVGYWPLRADQNRKRRKELLAICEACKKRIRGPAFASIKLQICFHEHCLSYDLETEIELPFHSQHRLLLGVIRRDELVRCNACRKEISSTTVAVFCGECCNLRFHRSCANEETRALRHNCHEHDLLYFGPKNVNRSTRFCHSCSEECSGSFLGCIDCKFDIHLECVPLPRDVKHSRHWHPLKFIDVVENDSGKYRCSMCKGKRNPEHQVYACEECLYIAHIDCVNSEDQPPEEILSYLEHQSRQPTSDSDQAQAISQLDMKGEENDTGSPNPDDHRVKEVEELTGRLVKVLQVEHSRSTMGRKLCEEVNEQESNVKQKCATEDEELVDINEKLAKIMAKMKELKTLVTEVEELEGGDKMLCLKS